MRLGKGYSVFHDLIQHAFTLQWTSSCKNHQWQRHACWRQLNMFLFNQCSTEFAVIAVSHIQVTLCIYLAAAEADYSFVVVVGIDIQLTRRARLCFTAVLCSSLLFHLFVECAIQFEAQHTYVFCEASNFHSVR